MRKSRQVSDMYIPATEKIRRKDKKNRGRNNGKRPTEND